MDPKEKAYIEQVIAEANRRLGIELNYFKNKNRAKIDQIINDTFPQQRAFIVDPAKRKAALTSRRAGKTNSAARMLLIAALNNPSSYCLYIALTRSSARNIIWYELKEMNRKYGIGGIANETLGQLALPNNARILLLGADKQKEVEKYRGVKVALAVIDEAAFFGSFLPYLVKEVLEPACMDLNGSIVMVGTPANHCKGIFYDATTNQLPGWSHHKWTMLDNTYTPHAAKWLEEQCSVYNISKDDAFAQREYLGRWIRSDESRVYLYDPSFNDYDGTMTDEHPWSYVLGVDLGFTDQTAFVVWAYSTQHNVIYEQESYGCDKMLLSDIANEIKALLGEYGTFSRIVCDTGGLGKSIVEEIKKRYKLPICAAEKKNKFEFIEVMNSDFKAGRIKIIKGSELSDQLELIQYDEERKKEDTRFRNDVADAGLYGYRECRHWLHIQPSVTATPNSQELQRQEANKIFKHEIEAARKRKLEEQLYGGWQDD